MSITRIIKNLLLDVEEGEPPTVVEIKRHVGLFDITYGFWAKRGRREWGGTGYESAGEAEEAARRSTRNRP